MTRILKKQKVPNSKKLLTASFGCYGQKAEVPKEKEMRKEEQQEGQ